MRNAFNLQVQITPPQRLQFGDSELWQSSSLLSAPEHSRTTPPLILPGGAEHNPPFIATASEVHYI